MALPHTEQGFSAAASPRAVRLVLAAVGALAAAVAPWLADVAVPLGLVAGVLALAAWLIGWVRGGARTMVLAAIAAAVVTALGSLFSHGERFGPAVIAALLLGILATAVRDRHVELPEPALSWLAAGARMTVGTVVSVRTVGRGAVEVDAAFTDASGGLSHLLARGPFPAGGGPRQDDPVVVWFRPDEPSSAVLRYNRPWAEARRTRPVDQPH